MDLFKNAARIHTAFAVARYLMANADGRQDGAEKAQRHIELCSFYVAATHGAAPEQVIVDYSEAFEAVHEATQKLTSYMDEQIGFPLTGRPDYDRLAPLFFDRFHALAMQALRLNMAEQAPVQAVPDGVVEALQSLKEQVAAIVCHKLGHPGTAMAVQDAVILLINRALAAAPQPPKEIGE